MQLNIFFSCRLLQPNQRHLRRCLRVLFRANMSNDVGRRKVRKFAEFWDCYCFVASERACATCIIFRYEYFWADGVTYKKPTKLPAPQYVSLLMDWIDSKINDEEVFPSTTGWESWEIRIFLRVS